MVSKSVNGVVSFGLGDGGFEFDGAGIDAFNAPAIENLDAASLAIVHILGDCSGSMGGVIEDVKQMMGFTVDAFQSDAEVAANTVLRISTFEGNEGVKDHTEGFQKVPDVGQITSGIFTAGSTPLKKAVLHAIEGMVAYAKYLKASDFNSNGQIVVISDGGDTDGGPTLKQIAEAIKAAKEAKIMMSFRVIVIGINTGSNSAADLASFCKGIGARFIDAGDATPETIRAIGVAMTSSVVEMSQSASAGAPSKDILDV